MKNKVLMVWLTIATFAPFIFATVQVSGEQNQLVITIPSSVNEGNYFNVIVSVNDQLVDHAQITFLDKIYYSSFNGTSILAPTVDKDTSYLLSASKEGYQSNEATILVTNIGEEQKLAIEAPSKVNESEVFTVTVTNLNGDPIEGAFVAFYNFSSTTDENGKIQVIAPDVDSDTSYILSADKTGFVSTQQTIIVQNKEGATQSTIYGWIFTEQRTPLENTFISVRLHIDNTNGNVISLWKSTLSDEMGKYILRIVLSGTIEVRAEKTGYETVTKTITVIPGNVIEVNFSLQELSVQPGENENRTLIEDAIQNGNMGAELTIQQTAGNAYESDVQMYSDVSIRPILVNEKEVTLVVSSENHKGGKTIALSIDPRTFNLGDNIQVKYDGKTIDMANDINDVLNPDDDGLNPEYLICMGTDGPQMLISVPHFSEHTISISSVIEAFGGTTAVMIYIAFSAIIAVAAVVHMRKMWR